MRYLYGKFHLTNAGLLLSRVFLNRKIASSAQELHGADVLCDAGTAACDAGYMSRAIKRGKRKRRPRDLTKEWSLAGVLERRRTRQLGAEKRGRFLRAKTISFTADRSIDRSGRWCVRRSRDIRYPSCIRIYCFTLGVSHATNKDVVFHFRWAVVCGATRAHRLSCRTKSYLIPSIVLRNIGSIKIARWINQRCLRDRTRFVNFSVIN